MFILFMKVLWVMYLFFLSRDFSGVGCGVVLKVLIFFGMEEDVVVELVVRLLFGIRFRLVW